MAKTKPIVKVYCTSTCPWCVKAKDYLKKHKIEFEEINVTLNPERKKEVFEKSGQGGVPVIEINGRIIIGFDEDEIVDALDL